MKIASARRIANIAINDAMILAHDTTLGRCSFRKGHGWMEFWERTGCSQQRRSSARWTRAANKAVETLQAACPTTIPLTPVGPLEGDAAAAGSHDRGGQYRPAAHAREDCAELLTTSDMLWTAAGWLTPA